MKALKINFNIREDYKLKIIAVLTICLLTGGVFANSIHNEFTNWDDQSLIVNNSQIKSLSIDNIEKIFNPFAGGTFQPVRVLSYAIDYKFFKLNPLGYHIHNIILHAFASILLFLSLCIALPQITEKRKMDNAGVLIANRYIISSFFVALLFAVHTVNVEAVTWLSSRKYVLLSFFSFLSLYCYLKSTEDTKLLLWLNLLSLLFFIMAVLSSPFGVVLPGLFFLYEYCRDTILNPFVVFKKRFFHFLPYMVFGSLLFILIFTKLVKSSGGAVTSYFHGNFLYTLFTIFQVFFDYLRNFLCPLWLNNRYVDYVFLSFTDYYKVGLGALFMLAAFVFSIWNLLTGKRMVLFCCGWFFISWLPASNIIPISIKMADRYVYLASVGVFILFTEYIIFNIYNYGYSTSFLQVHVKLFDFAIVACMVIIIGALSVNSINRNKIWKNSGVLWSDSIKKDPRNMLAHNNLGTWLFYQGHIKEAERQYKIAHMIDKHAELPILNLGPVLIEQGKREEAIALYKKMFAHKPDSMPICKTLADLLIKENRLKEASKYFSKILDAEPDDPVSIGWQSFILNSLKRYDKAEKLLTRGIKKYPDRAELHYNYAVSLYETGNYKKALKEYYTVVKLEPENAVAYEGLGKTCFKMDQIDRAIYMYKKSLEINSGSASVYNNLGNAYQAKGKLNKAVLSYKKALEIHPGFVESLYNLCLIKEKKGLIEDAFTCYKSILASNKNNAEAMNNLGSIFLKKSELDKALALFTKAVKIKPDYLDALYNLGTIYMQKKDFNKALYYFDRALKIKANDFDVLNSEGIIFYKKGNFNEASFYFAKALAVKPDDAFIHFNLGIALAKAGKTEKALYHLQKTIKLDPDNKMAKKILAQIR